MKKLEPIQENDWVEVNEVNRSLLEDFLTDSTELSEKSRKTYRSNLMIWFVYVKDFLKNKPHNEVTSLEFKRYQNWLLSRDCSSSDIRNKRSSISSLNNYIEVYRLQEFGNSFRNFINKSVKAPPQEYIREKDPLTKAEISELLEKLEKLKEYQKIAWFMFSFDTACRRAESRQLLKNVADAELVVKEKDGKKISYYETHSIRCKGGKIRKFKFQESTMVALKKWLEVRGKDDCPYMFVHKKPPIQVGETTFNGWTALIGKIAGKRVHPHAIRLARSQSIIVEEGRDDKVAQMLLGHNDVSTTLKHYVVRDETEIADELYDED